MCGLVGVISKRPNGFTKEHQEIFATMLFVDTFRGRDSTGVFVVENDGSAFVAKSTGYAPLFMQTREYDEAMRRAWNRGSAMIGHNRAATRGTVNDDNAHPFDVNSELLLVHNGTMRSDHKKHADVEVDSHAIAHLIHEKESVADALGSFYGAYALIWYDMRTGNLCFVRNDERPLFWLELDDAWLWASEKSFLNFAVERVGNVKVKSEPTMLTEDFLQTFTLENKGWKVRSEKLEIKKPWERSMGQNMGTIMGGAAGGWRNDLDDDSVLWDQSTRQDPPFRQTGRLYDVPHGSRSHIEEAAELGRQVAAHEQRLREANADRVAQGKHPLPGYPCVGSRSGAEPTKQEPAGGSHIEDAERALAHKQNKKVTHGHYTKYVLPSLGWNTTVHCSGFDYGYANGKDSTAGFYLYSSPFDDQDIIVRHWFPSSAVTEERMVQLAGCEYVFEFTLGQRQWHPWDVDEIKRNEGVVNEDTGGYCIIRSHACTMVSDPALQPNGKVPH